VSRKTPSARIATAAARQNLAELALARSVNFLRPVVGSVTSKRRMMMLWTIAVVLMLLWVLGMVSSYTLGGFIHILLVLAVVTVLIRLISGRRVV
jgi:hypothetical protein